jgi:hypothetical protein
LGFGWAAQEVEANGPPPGGLAPVLEAAVFRALAKGVYQERGPALAKFAGDELDRLREDLAATDLAAMAAYRRELKSQLSQGLAVAPKGVARGPVAELTEMGFLNHELAKKRRHAPIRELARRAGQALRALKPCWMMSPMAVSAYLPAGEVAFDLGVVDEASQMTPESALGALARCRNVMVVGDANQLPPTNFFRKLAQSEGEEEEEEEERGVGDESILELANKVFRPGRRLRWHYRSRHESLIQFSNERVYGGELKVFPSVGARGLGVSLVKAGGLYRGGVNPIEAEAMARAAAAFMKESPGLSLGLVTMNQKQMELLKDQMEIARDRDPAVAAYVAKWEIENEGLESFFVKNLESVQGDERDVIFIGTVYGPEEKGGPVANRFGPINGLAGQRRLNVLFTRSKRRMTTFTSMEPGDVRASDDNLGAAMLRDWLIYCAARGQGPGPEKGQGLGEKDGLLALASQALTAEGFVVDQKEGPTAQGLDLAVSHPDWPGGYVLGLASDGPKWRSVKSARDRDRLIDQVLVGLGWRLYRIWSFKWLTDPKGEAEKLVKAAQDRLKELKGLKGGRGANPN